MLSVEVVSPPPEPVGSDSVQHGPSGSEGDRAGGSADDPYGAALERLIGAINSYPFDRHYYGVNQPSWAPYLAKHILDELGTPHMITIHEDDETPSSPLPAKVSAAIPNYSVSLELQPDADVVETLRNVLHVLQDFRNQTEPALELGGQVL